MITILLFFIAQSPTGYHFLEADGTIYIAAEEGVYRFDPQGPNLNRFTPLQGLPKGEIRFLAFDDGLVWVGTDSGIANADIRFNDWKVVLHQSAVGINFDDDYAYLATGSTIYRYEKLIEDIEPIDAQSGILIKDDTHILIVREDKSEYYNTKTEEVSKFGVPVWLSGTYPIESENYIGSINSNLILKERTGQEWHSFSIPEINDFCFLGDSIVFATDSGLIVFDPMIQGVMPYSWSYQKRVNDVACHSGFLAVATDSGIFEIGKGIKRESQVTGLPEERVFATFYSGDYLLAITDNFIAYRTESGWEWFKREKGKPQPQLIYWDDTGTYLVPFGQEIAFRGRTSYSYRKRWDHDTIEYMDTTIDITVNTNLLKGKLSGFYDNSERERIEYGIGYQSNHLIRRVFYGKDRFGLSLAELTPAQQGRGIGGEIGGNISVLGYHGEKIGRNRLDIFTGNLSHKQLTIQDSSYQSYRFYSIDTTEQPLQIDAIEIYYDDLDPETNDEKTLIDYTIAGHTGDFDLLSPVTEYSYNQEWGVVDLKKARTVGVIAVRYDGNEIIIDSTQMLKNRYWVGSGMLPYSFQLSITDDLGQSYPLDQFGIDDNHDRLVDDEWIDFEKGILHFPEEIINDTIGYYLNLEYSTKSALYQLSYHPVVRGSEKVYLDGHELKRAYDYVIDYSTGILLILKSELVGPGSQIEVHYEEEMLAQESEQSQTGLQLRIRPNDNIKIAPGGYNSEGKTIYTLPLEYVTKFIQLKTELISDQEDYGGATEAKVKKSGNYLKAKGVFVPDSIEDFGIMAARQGRWIKRGALGAGLEIHDLKIEAEYKRGLAKDSITEYNEDERIISLELKPEHLPYLIMKKGRWKSFDLMKNFHRIEAGHSFKQIRGKFGIGHEYGSFDMNDIYSELIILNTRFYQRRSETDDYISDKIELNSLINLFKGIDLISNLQVNDTYDKTGYTRFGRYLMLSSNISPWPIPFLFKCGYGMNLSGFTTGTVSIIEKDPPGKHLKKQWPILIGFEITSRLIITSRTTIYPIFEREYNSTRQEISVESYDYGEYQLTNNSRIIAQYNLKNSLHNQFIDYEHRIGNLIISPGLGSNIADVEEIGPRLKIEYRLLPLLRIYNQNQTFFARDYERSAHSIQFLIKPIKPFMLRLSSNLDYKTDTGFDYFVGFRADGLF